jgi:hypothetical protein
MRKSLGLVALLLCADPAMAETKTLKGCFEVKYSKDWMKKNTEQLVLQARVSLRLEKAPDSKPATYGRLSIKFKDGEDKWFSQRFECADNGESLACSMECDGGVFLMAQGKKGLRVLLRSTTQFTNDDCEGTPTLLSRYHAPESMLFTQKSVKACQ